MPPRRPSMARLDAGRAALARRDWRAAQEAFADALEERESASALEGLSEARWWLDEVPQSLRLREQAFALWERKGERARAARAALWLAREHADAQADLAAAAWLEHADRLAGDAGPERGWTDLMRARLAPSATAALAPAQRARACGSSVGDRDLERSAAAAAGRALVLTGCVDPGLQLLEEAAAAAMAGDVQDLHAAGDALAAMATACDAALDLERALKWCRLVDEFARRHHFVPLFTAGQEVYGGLLVATGRWAAAESALTRAARTVEARHPGLRLRPLARLAQLQVRQGRLEEAAALLAGCEAHAAACAAQAELHMARGRPAEAAALLERRLEVVGE
ncbi:MAG TPA: LuxR family transcriptional regulator, partial [Vicinamibacteria bacterium]|nr:LuxR family transcriptional regulator [Vicinamibacteria bacterium]